jgi:hypothetical protein
MDIFPHKIIGTGVLLIHRDSLHDIKVGVWCTVKAKQIIGLIFYVETINSVRCVRVILTELFLQLTEEE